MTDLVRQSIYIVGINADKQTKNRSCPVYTEVSKQDFYVPPITSHSVATLLPLGLLNLDWAEYVGHNFFIVVHSATCYLWVR